MTYQQAQTQATKLGFLDMAYIDDVLLLVYPFDPFKPLGEGYAEISAYYPASHMAYTATSAFCIWCGEQGTPAQRKDDLPLKQWAARAGLGVYGKHQLIIHPAYGTNIVFQAVRVALEDTPACTPKEGLHPACTSCELCQHACPTGALGDDPPFTYALCLRSHMITNEETPLPMREKTGTRLVGCEICQRVCPLDAGSVFKPVPDDLAAMVRIDTLLSMDKAKYEKLSVLLGTNFSRIRRIRAQGALCAGNSGDASYIPLLEKLLQEEETESAHAAWAIEKLQGTSV